MALNDIPYGYMLRRLPLKDRMRLQMGMETAPPSAGSPFSFNLDDFMRKRGHERPPPAGEFVPGRGPRNYFGTSVERRWTGQDAPGAESLIKVSELGPLDGPPPPGDTRQAKETVTAAVNPTAPALTAESPAPAPSPADGGGGWGGLSRDVMLGGVAGMSAANADMDWRTTPAQALSRALSGFMGGALQARGQEDERADRAEGRALRNRHLDMQTRAMEREDAQAAASQAAMSDAMANLSPEDQRTARLLMSVGDKDGLSRLLGVGGGETKVVGNSLVDESGKLLFQAPERGLTPFQQASLEIDRAQLELQRQKASLGDGGGAMTPYQQASIGLREQELELARKRLEQQAAGGGGEGAEQPLSPEELKSMGFQEGSVVVRTGQGGYRVLQKPPGGPLVQVGTPAKPPAGYRWADGSFTELEPIPGGPAEAASAEIAGKASMLPGSLQDVQSVRDALIDPATQEVNRTAIMAANPPIPFVGALPVAGGRDTEAKITGAIDTLVRARTGAAATESEMDRMVNMYMPRPTDDDATVKSKMERLNRDLLVMQEQFARGKGGVENAVQAPAPASGGPSPASGMAAVGEQLAQPMAVPAPGAVMDGYRFKGGNPNDPNAWEQVQ